MGSGHCNNNNAKSNLNYALKRLGRNNPRHKHKRGGGALTINCRDVGWAGGRVRQRPLPSVWTFLLPGRCDLSTVVLIFGCKDDAVVYFGK